MKRRSIQLALAGIVLIVVTSCGTTGKMSAKSKLVANTWELNTIKGRTPDTLAFRTGLPFFLFEKGGKLLGSTGCNNTVGKYDLGKSTMKIDPGAITRMACQGNGEELFLRAITNVKNFKIDGGKLTLLDGSNEIMTFVPKK